MNDYNSIKERIDLGREEARTIDRNVNRLLMEVEGVDFVHPSGNDAQRAYDALKRPLYQLASNDYHQAGSI